MISEHSGKCLLLCVVWFEGLFVLFETGSFYLALAYLEVTMQTKLASNSQRSPCLCFQVLGLRTFATITLNLCVCDHVDRGQKTLTVFLSAVFPGFVCLLASLLVFKGKIFLTWDLAHSDKLAGHGLHGLLLPA